MGTRYHVMVILDGLVRVRQWGHHDGYPSGAGANLADFLHHEMNELDFRSALQTWMTKGDVRGQMLKSICPLIHLIVYNFLSETMAVNDASLLKESPVHSWIGVAAADKAPKSISLEVSIPELMPAATGTLAPASAQQTVSLTDINGSKINASVTTKNTITATYLGNSSNRKYPPDVVKGESVRITKLANADKYYWESLGRDDGLRKTETHRIETANRANFDDPVDDDHTYSMEIDTKDNKHIRLKTSKGNGESFGYLLTLDGKNGNIQLADDGGNSFTINSSSAQVIMRNAKQSFIMLNGEDGIIGVPRDLTLKAGRQTLIDSPLISINAQSGSGVVSIAANAIAQAAKSAVTTTAPAIGLNGAVQIPSILTAMNIRAATYANGAPGSTYAAASVNLGQGSGSVPSVSPDTTMPASQRHAAAWEDISNAMSAIISCFAEIKAKIAVPLTSDTDPINQNTMTAKMNNLQGT